MAKKSKKNDKNEQPEAPKADEESKIEQKLPAAPAPSNAPKLPPEVEKKLQEIKDKLDKFKEKVLEKFDQYVIGISLLPPEQKPAAGQPGAPLPPAPAHESNSQTPPPPKVDEKDIVVIVLVDDSDSKKMSKWELRDKLQAIIANLAKEIDPHLKPDTILLSELWQSCYDAKYDLLRMVALSAPIYDKGMLSAVKIAELHKNMVLKKFEKYIISYVLAGSLTQGRATPTSDIDVWIVIDDTDVKKMTRAELKDKLRAIIIGMGIEAGDVTGIKNKLNIQVYILTDFWDSLREANPIIFTLLRDGVPFYDRGIFMPWKQLLRMGKIKPSREAIDLFMSSGDQMVRKVRRRITDMGIEDTYYAILTPSQAALMLYGIPPPTPRETPEVMRDIFVNKLKLLEDKYIEILENNIKVRKDIEHGTKKELTGKELDEMLDDADKFLKRIDRLFKQIEKIKEEESMLSLYDRIVTIIRDVLKLEGVERVADEEVVSYFENELISTGKIPAKMLRELNEIIAAKKEYDAGKLNKADLEKARTGSEALIKFLVEYMQRKRGRELDRAKIRVKYGEKFGEVIVLGEEAFIVHDVDATEPMISKASVKPDGTIGVTKNSNLDELENVLASAKIPPKVFIREKLFESLKNIFGGDVEILVNY